MKEDQERCLQAGMNDYIPKPIQPSALACVIGKHLSVEQTPHSQPVPGSQSEGKEILDRRSLLRRLDGDEILMKEILNLFQQNTPTLLSGLRKAVEHQDADGVQRWAHSLKGSAGNVSADLIQAHAEHIEILGKEGRLEDASQEIGRASCRERV